MHIANNEDYMSGQEIELNSQRSEIKLPEDYAYSQVMVHHHNELLSFISFSLPQTKLIERLDFIFFTISPMVSPCLEYAV